MTVCECVVARVRALLKENGMSQYRLEQESGIQHGALNRIMRCENKGINLQTVAMLARGFHITIVEFLNDPLFLSDEMDID